MNLNNEEVIYSSEKCKITKGEYNGKQCIKKTGSFSREAVNAIARINSPYIPHIYEIGDDYIISEYVDGVDLSNGKISPQNVLDIALELCDALEALHKNNVIHRDVKPSNIILGNDGHIKLIDFDAARINKATVDKDTVFIGTDGFAPPEQFGFTQTDERSDIYAFGVTIKLLLGEDYNGALYKHVIGKCIRFNPEQRYRGFKEVRSALFRIRLTPAVYMIFSAALVCFAIGVINFVMATNISSATDDSSNTQSVLENSSNNLFVPQESIPSDMSHGTVQTSTNISESVSHPASESDFPMESERFYSISWELLTLPEAFPCLRDKVTFFYYFNEGASDIISGYHMGWNVMTEKETSDIAQALREWMGGDSDFRIIPGDSDYTEWLMENESFRVHITWGNEAPSYTWINIFPKGEDNNPTELDLSLSDSAVTEYSRRSLKWEEAGIPGFLPKLTDKVSKMDYTDGAYYIKWDVMKIEELEAVIQKIVDSFDGEYIFNINFNSDYYIWELEGSLNSIRRKITITYVTKFSQVYGKTPQVSIAI